MYMCVSGLLERLQSLGMRRQYGLGVLQFVLSSVIFVFHFVIAYLMVILCSHCVELFGNETKGLGMRQKVLE